MLAFTNADQANAAPDYVTVWKGYAPCPRRPATISRWGNDIRVAIAGRIVPTGDYPSGLSVDQIVSYFGFTPKPLPAPIEQARPAKCSVCGKPVPCPYVGMSGHAEREDGDPVDCDGSGVVIGRSGDYVPCGRACAACDDGNPKGMTMTQEWLERLRAERDAAGDRLDAALERVCRCPEWDSDAYIARLEDEAERTSDAYLDACDLVDRHNEARRDMVRQTLAARRAGAQARICAAWGRRSCWPA